MRGEEGTEVWEDGGEGSRVWEGGEGSGRGGD